MSATRLRSCRLCVPWQLLGVTLKRSHGSVSRSPRRLCNAAKPACQWAVQESQYFHLAADYVRSKISISRCDPLVEDESIEALAPLSRFSSQKS